VQAGSPAGTPADPGMCCVIQPAVGQAADGQLGQTAGSPKEGINTKSI